MTGDKQRIHAEAVRLISRHCGPVLLGCKPASLFVVRSKACFYCLFELLRRLNSRTNLVILKRDAGSMLVIAYNAGMLQRTLLDRDIQEPLGFFGYPEKGPFSLSRCLQHLQRRFCQSGEFPHEIGFFLGYPTTDVMGFIREKGRNYKYAGPWKVYGNVDTARNCHCQRID